MLKSFLTASLVAIGTAIASNPAQALTFNLGFDDTPDDTVTPPLVGTGSFSFDDTVPDGTYGLTTLPNFDFNISFGSITFANTNITTTQSTVLVIISGGGTQVNFSNTNPSGDGGFGGSIDFINGDDGLSFEPPNFEGFEGNLNLYALLNANSEDPEFFGNYSNPVTAVPFEFSPVLGLGILGGLFAAKKLSSKLLKK